LRSIVILLWNIGDGWSTPGASQTRFSNVSESTPIGFWRGAPSFENSKSYAVQKIKSPRLFFRSSQILTPDRPEGCPGSPSGNFYLPTSSCLRDTKKSNFKIEFSKSLRAYFEASHKLPRNQKSRASDSICDLQPIKSEHSGFRLSERPKCKEIQRNPSFSLIAPAENVQTSSRSLLMGWKSQIESDGRDFWFLGRLWDASKYARGDLENSILKSIFSDSVFKNVKIWWTFSVFEDFAHSRGCPRISGTFLEPSAEPETTKKWFLKKNVLDLPPIFFCARNSQNT